MTKTFREVSTNSVDVRYSHAKPIRRIWLTLMGGILTGLGVAYLSKDWCWTTTSSALLAATLIWLADRYLLVGLAQGKPWIRKAQVMLLVAIACGLSFCLKLDRNAVFEKALGASPPAGVRELEVDSTLLVAPPGDQIILLRFIADKQTIEAIVAQRGFVRDDPTLESWKMGNGSWQSLCESVFSNFAQFAGGGKAWEQPAQMRHPILYRWESPGGVTEKTTLLWDAESGRAYVLYTFG